MLYCGIYVCLAFTVNILDLYKVYGTGFGTASLISLCSVAAGVWLYRLTLNHISSSNTHLTLSMTST